MKEDDFNFPTTMYGANKLYCEHLGRYYSRHYKQLAADVHSGKVDFRCLRFPGLISAETMPSGGTSDYAPEMIHAAAAGKPYDCFVRPDTRIPFMAMPDAVEAILRLTAAPRETLSRTVYNVGAFAPTAAEIEAEVQAAFPAAKIGTQVDVKRQGIVDTWPADVDDSAARRDWGHAAALRFPLLLSRLPDANDPEALRERQAIGERCPGANGRACARPFPTQEPRGRKSYFNSSKLSKKPFSISAETRPLSLPIIPKKMASSITT